MRPPSFGVRAVLWACLTIAIVAYQLGPMLAAKWELFDDAETLSWTEPGARLSIAGAPAVLMHRTEVGQFGTFARYRPVYYTTRVLETVMLGANPRAWHLWCATMFGAVILLAFLAFDLWTGPLLGGALTIFALANWYWQDVWLHLGPAEGLGSVGLALFGLGAALASRDRARDSAWLVAVGTTIAVGSKESFLPLIAPALLLLHWAWNRSGRSRGVLALAMVPVVVTGAVTLSTLLYSLHTGTDIYLRPVGAGSRFAWIIGRRGIVVGALFVLPFVLEMLGWKMLADGSKTLERRAWWHSHAVVFRWIAWGAGALVAFQFFIYSPIIAWPTWASRYDVPGRLASPVLIGALCVLFAQWCAMQAGPKWYRRLRVAQALAIAALLLIARREFPWGLRGAAIRQVAYADRLDARLNGIAAAMRGRRELPLIVRWNSGGEIEAFGAVLQLLRQRGIDGPFFLAPSPGSGVTERYGFAAWNSQMRGISEHGGTWYNATVRPWSDLLRAASEESLEVRLSDYEVPTWRIAR